MRYPSGWSEKLEDKKECKLPDEDKLNLNAIPEIEGVVLSLDGCAIHRILSGLGSTENSVTSLQEKNSKI